jgi:hypothetical protein
MGVATPAIIVTAIVPTTFFGHVFLPSGQNSWLTVPGHLFLLLLRPHSLLSAKLATYLYPGPCRMAIWSHSSRKPSPYFGQIRAQVR